MIGSSLSPRREVLPATGRTTWIAVVVATMLLSAVMVGSYVHSYPTLGPIDEMQHVDYLYSIRTLDIPRGGEKVGQHAMREEACRTVDSTVYSPPCVPGRQYDPTQFAWTGDNTAAAHPPLYYAAAALVGTAVDKLPGIESFVTGARLAGALWLSLASLLMIVAARMLDISWRSTLPAVLIVASSQTALHAAATVNPDSMSLLVGALVLVAVLWWEHHPNWQSMLALIVVAAFCVLVKSMNVLVLGAAALYLLLRAACGAPELVARMRARRYVLTATLVVLAGSVGVVAWVMVVRARLLSATANQMDHMFAVRRFGFNEIGSQFLALVMPIADPYVPGFFNATQVWAVVSFVTALVIAVVFGSALYANWSTRGGALVAATAISLLLAGTVVTLANYVLLHAYIPLPARYGLVLVPFAALVLALTNDRSRGVRYLASAAAVASVAVALIGTLS